VKAGHEVTLATLAATEGEQQECLELFGDRCAIVLERISAHQSLRNCLFGLASGAPLQAAYSWKPAMAARLAALVAERNFEAVHIEHLRGAPYALLLQELLARHGKKTPVVWDSVDCISWLFEQAATGSSSFSSRLIARFELNRTRRYEARLVRQFPRIVVTSQIDRRQLLQLAHNQPSTPAEPGNLEKRIKVVPNGVDLTYFQPLDGKRETAKIVISGKMSYHANISAAVRFAKEAMPRIWVERPEAQLWIVGKDPARQIRELKSDRILITGTVPDIRPFLQRATVAVAPIQYGAGVQNKVLEALACGTPVVATPQAVAGLVVHPGVHLMVAQSMEGLADSVVSLLKNPGQRRFLGRSGRCYVETNHNWHSSVGLLEDVYREAWAECEGSAARTAADTLIGS